MRAAEFVDPGLQVKVEMGISCGMHERWFRALAVRGVLKFFSTEAMLALAEWRCAPQQIPRSCQYHGQNHLPTAITVLPHNEVQSPQHALMDYV